MIIFQNCNNLRSKIRLFSWKHNIEKGNNGGSSLDILHFSKDQVEGDSEMVLVELEKTAKTYILIFSGMLGIFSIHCLIFFFIPIILSYELERFFAEKVHS